MSQSQNIFQIELEQEQKILGGDADLDRAMLSLGMKCCLADQDPSEHDLIEHQTDGPNDLGIDAYWIDSDNARLLLFQSKYSDPDPPTTLGRKVVDEFTQACRGLGDADYVNDNGNAEIRDAHPEILEAIVDPDFSLELLIVTNSKVAKAAAGAAKNVDSDLSRSQSMAKT